MSILRSRFALILTTILVLQAGFFYAVAARPEKSAEIPPLTSFPESIGGFTSVREIPLDQETKDVLRADDTLERIYLDPGRRHQVVFFVAYFKTQRYGQSPHSPKNCLPGSGWEPVYTDRPTITVPGWETPIVVNRYLVEKGDDKSVILYWYQSHNRVIASEYSAKFWLVADALRFNRSDTALVRVSVPVGRDDEDSATRMAEEFVRTVFPVLRRQMPL